MPSDNFERFRHAILKKKQVICTYQSHVREVCPHVLGYKDGKEKVLTFQFAGTSKTGLPSLGEWRCFEVAQVGDLQMRDGAWKTAEHRERQTCIDQVVIEVLD